MANIREIQGRIKSIQDTMKITNAMYMISSTKLRRARKNLEETEPYYFTLQALIARILRHMPDIKNQYFDVHKQKAEKERTKGYVVVTADKGLAGAYNHNVLKIVQQQIEEIKKQGGNYRLYVVGELGRQYFAGKGISVAEHFYYTAQNPTLHRARIISETLLSDFVEEKLDEVYIIYTKMKNSIISETEMLQLLPCKRENFDTKEIQKFGVSQEEIKMLPSPQAVLDNIVPNTIMGYLYSALIESFCSEQNARMMAMEAANKSASAMIHTLGIEYNRIRQAMITQEITEVIAGAKAQKKKKQQV